MIVVWRHFFLCRSLLQQRRKPGVHPDPSGRAGADQAVGLPPRQLPHHGVRPGGCTGLGGLSMWGNMCLRCLGCCSLDLTALHSPRAVEYPVLQQAAGRIPRAGALERSSPPCRCALFVWFPPPAAWMCSAKRPGRLDPVQPPLATLQAWTTFSCCVVSTVRPGAESAARDRSVHAALPAWHCGSRLLAVASCCRT